MAKGSMPVPAPASSASQASRVRRIRAAATTAVSRLKKSSNAGAATVLAHHAALREVDAGKLPVSVVELVADRTQGLRPAAADLGCSELKAVGLLDAHTMLGAGDWIEDRLAAH